MASTEVSNFSAPAYSAAMTSHVAGCQSTTCQSDTQSNGPDYFPRTRRAFAIGELVGTLEEQSVIARIFTGDVKEVKPKDEGLTLLIKELLNQLNGQGARKWIKVLDVLLDTKHNSDACIEFLEQMASIVDE